MQIALVGKYTSGTDAYLSVTKALQHAAIAVNLKLEIVWVTAEDLEDDADKAAQDAAFQQLRKCHGILVQGGFGDRGVLGKVRA